MEARSRRRDSASRGFLWIIHGIGEHSYRYNELALFLCQLGFDVLAPDLPGHGLSAKNGGQKRLATVPEMIAEIRASFSYWIEDGPLSAQNLEKIPWHLLGHSMGGLISLAWILDGRLDTKKSMPFARRAYISAPALKLKLEVPKWKLAAADILKNFAPNLKIPSGIIADELSYDVANVAAYRKDPLVHPYASPKLFFSIRETADQIIASPKK